MARSFETSTVARHLSVALHYSKTICFVRDDVVDIRVAGASVTGRVIDSGGGTYAADEMGCFVPALAWGLLDPGADEDAEVDSEYLLVKVNSPAPRVDGWPCRVAVTLVGLAVGAHVPDREPTSEAADLDLLAIIGSKVEPRACYFYLEDPRSDDENRKRLRT